MEWSDDFEPNKMKSNRNSIWIKTVTISPVNGMKKDSHHNTYPISLGPKNSSHESVEVRFKEDLKQLRNGSTRMFYNGITKSMYRIHAELILSIQDQPERRGKNHVALGVSNFTARWGYLLNINQVKEKIIPCKTCENNLFSIGNISRSEQKLLSCSKCTSWDYLSKKELLSYKPTDKYPIKNVNLFPKEQTFEQLIKATDQVHENRVNGTWNKSESRTFMQSEGLNKNT